MRSSLRAICLIAAIVLSFSSSMAQVDKLCNPPVDLEYAPWLVKDGWIVYWWPDLNNCASYSLDVSSDGVGGVNYFNSAWLGIYQNLPDHIVIYPVYQEIPTRFALSTSGNPGVGTLRVQYIYTRSYWDFITDNHYARGQTPDLKESQYSNNYGRVNPGDTVYCSINIAYYTINQWTLDELQWATQHELGHGLCLDDGYGIMYNEINDRRPITLDEKKMISSVYNDARVECCQNPVSTGLREVAVSPYGECVRISWETSLMQETGSMVQVMRQVNNSGYSQVDGQIMNAAGLSYWVDDCSPPFGHLEYLIQISMNNINAAEAIVTYENGNGLDYPEILAVSPNPTRSSMEIQYYVPEGDNYCLEVFDLRGRRIRSIIEGRGSPGKGAIQWAFIDNN